MSVSFGFGGYNAACVLRAFDGVRQNDVRVEQCPSPPFQPWSPRASPLRSGIFVSVKINPLLTGPLPVLLSHRLLADLDSPFQCQRRECRRVVGAPGLFGNHLYPHRVFPFHRRVHTRPRPEEAFSLSMLLAAAFLFWPGQASCTSAAFTRYSWGFYPKAGSLHFVYLALLAIMLGLGSGALFAYRRAVAEQRLKVNQINYVIVSTIIYSVASIDFLANYGAAFYPGHALYQPPRGNYHLCDRSISTSRYQRGAQA